MKPTPLQRRLLLAAGLVATIAVVFGQGNPPEEAPVQVAIATPGAARPPPPRLDVERLARAAPTEGARDLFAPRSWAPPRKVVRVAPPVEIVPEPVAPPLPFEYVGQMEGREGLVVHLAREGDLLTAKAGDMLGADYRLESISPDALVFTYLPLAQRQTLAAVRPAE